MSSKRDEPVGEQSLRMRAVARLTGASDPRDSRASSAAALAILHELASSPATAADSLKLLHELQVYQVELDLQAEELRRSVTELEGALNRSVQLFEFSPAACFIVDRSAALCELNRAGARLLGFDRDAVLDRALDGFLDSDSSRALHAVLTRVGDGAAGDGCELRFVGRDGASRSAYASVGPDPAGPRFLVACIEIGDPPKSAAR